MLKKKTLLTLIIGYTCFIASCSSLTRIQVLPYELINGQKMPIREATIEFYEVYCGDSPKKVPLEKDREFQNIFVLFNFHVDSTRRNNSFELIISKKGYETKKMIINDFRFFNQFPENNVYPYQILMEVKLTKM